MAEGRASVEIVFPVAVVEAGVFAFEPSFEPPEQPAASANVASATGRERTTTASRRRALSAEPDLIGV